MVSGEEYKDSIVLLFHIFQTIVGGEKPVIIISSLKMTLKYWVSLVFRLLYSAVQCILSLA